jgi:hypothetical protein
MMVQCYGSEFEIPDQLIDKYFKDFDGLPGSGLRENICQIRDSIYEIVDIVEEDPDILHEAEYLKDFMQALAMKQALQNHGILYDA